MYRLGNLTGDVPYQRLVTDSLSVKEFLGKSVRPSSAKSYASAWKKWTDYVDGLSAESCPGLYFQRVPSLEGRIERLLLFYVHLYDQKLRGEQVSMVSAGVRSPVPDLGQRRSFCVLDRRLVGI